MNKVKLQKLVTELRAEIKHQLMVREDYQDITESNRLLDDIEVELSKQPEIGDAAINEAAWKLDEELRKVAPYHQLPPWLFNNQKRVLHAAILTWLEKH